MYVWHVPLRTTYYAHVLHAVLLATWQLICVHQQPFPHWLVSIGGGQLATAIQYGVCSVNWLIFLHQHVFGHQHTFTH